LFGPCRRGPSQIVGVETAFWGWQKAAT
jgi:hypothetical protein